MAEATTTNHEKCLVAEFRGGPRRPAGAGIAGVFRGGSRRTFFAQWSRDLAPLRKAYGSADAVPWHPGTGTRRIARPRGCHGPTPGRSVLVGRRQGVCGASDHYQVREPDLYPRLGPSRVRPRIYTFTASVNSSGAKDMILCTQKRCPGAFIIRRGSPLQFTHEGF